MYKATVRLKHELGHYMYYISSEKSLAEHFLP